MLLFTELSVLTADQELLPMHVAVRCQNVWTDILLFSNINHPRPRPLPNSSHTAVKKEEEEEERRLQHCRCRLHCK